MKALTLLVAIFIALPNAANAQSPSALVGTFHDALLGVMKEADALGFKGRYDRLKNPVQSSFDHYRMIRIAVGEHWAKAGEAEKQQLLAAFERMSTSTYAQQFSGFDGESFETVSEKPGPRKTVLVATRINIPNKSPARLTYVVLKSGESWKIVDVLLDDSVSQLAVRRSEYRKVLKSGGIAELITVLNKKSEELAKP
ncbi:MAG: ABC transporter substrate-binding protein [Rhodospirillales bacterium]|nr:ABC transporter substrate-binding protein [Rhodospirillales bacterium]